MTQAEFTRGTSPAQVPLLESINDSDTSTHKKLPFPLAFTDPGLCCRCASPVHYTRAGHEGAHGRSNWNVVGPRARSNFGGRPTRAPCERGSFSGRLGDGSSHAAVARSEPASNRVGGARAGQRPLPLRHVRLLPARPTRSRPALRGAFVPRRNAALHLHRGAAWEVRAAGRPGGYSAPPSIHARTTWISSMESGVPPSGIREPSMRASPSSFKMR